MVAAQWTQRLSEGVEVAGNKPRPLVDQLIERVLAIGSRLAPINRACRVIHLGTLEGHVLAVALHGQLLEIGGESFQVLLVGQHSNRLSAEEIVVPDAQK